jgi:ABC-type Fe3+ transport system permease subunit
MQATDIVCAPSETQTPCQMLRIPTAADNAAAPVSKCFFLFAEISLSTFTRKKTLVPPSKSKRANALSHTRETDRQTDRQRCVCVCVCVCFWCVCSAYVSCVFLVCVWEERKRETQRERETEREREKERERERERMRLVCVHRVCLVCAFGVCTACMFLPFHKVASRKNLLVTISGISPMFKITCPQSLSMGCFEVRPSTLSLRRY